MYESIHHQNAQLFVRLFYCLEMNFAKTSILWVLLARGAIDQWLETSSRALSRDLGELVPHTIVYRAIETLVESGLIYRKPYPNYYTKYKLNIEALEILLSQSLPSAPYLPGLGTEPIAFLKRTQPTASSSHQPEPSYE